MIACRHESLKWAGTFCYHCTQKWMLPATLHVLPPWGSSGTRAWGCGSREAVTPHMQWWEGCLFYRECFPLLLEHKSAFEACKQCSPCTSAWACSHSTHLLVSGLVHQEKKANNGPCIIFPMELLENGGSVSGRASVLEDKADTAQVVNNLILLWINGSLFTNFQKLWTP